jgi:methylglutaconyl-CoA hydratase
MNKYQTLELKTEANVLEVALNRPEVHNAFDETMIRELLDLFNELAGRENIRSVVLTGNGRTFCAGADLSMMEAAASYSHEQNVAEAQSIYELMLAVDSCPKPVIGRINGSAVGGGAGLVSCCDIVIAVDSAKFSFSETRLGLVPAVISPFVIAKIGSSNARELFLTGERFNAVRAQAIGLVNQLAQEATLDDIVAERIGQLRQAAPGAQTAAKELIREATHNDPSDLKDHLSELIASRRASEEGQEGMNAFLEKRKPKWRET